MKKQIHLLGGLMVLIALLAMNSTAFADFVIKGGATVKVMSGTTLTATSDVVIQSTGKLENSGTVTLKGDFTNDGIADLGTGSFVLAGSALQQFGGSSLSEIEDLTVNNTEAGVVLTGSLRVDNSLTLTDGIVDMVDYSLILGPSITQVLGTPSVTNMIVTNGSGELRKEIFGITYPYSFTYPVGDNVGTAEYTPLPVEVQAGDFIAGDYIGVNCGNTKHPNNNSYDHYLTRYWDIRTSTIASLDYDVTATYLTADVFGTEANIREGLFITPEWFVYDPVNTGTHQMTFTELSESGVITGVEFQYIAAFGIYLEGAYDYVTPSNKLMRPELRTFEFLPLTASEAYPEYSGPEEVISISDIPANTIDWVLVEMRISDVADNATLATKAETVAGFLLSNGTIVAADGVSALPFKSNIASGLNPFFIVHHRNHIPVMSAVAPTLGDAGNMAYDFSTDPESAYYYTSGTPTYSLIKIYDGGPNPGDDVYGLHAGDANHDYIVTYGDKQPIDDLVDPLSPTVTGYNLSDTNMDGNITYGDKQYIDDNIKTILQLPY